MISASCELSNTGQVVWPVIVVGLVLLLVGLAALVLLGRRRKRARGGDGGPGGAGGAALVLLLVLAGASGVVGGSPVPAQAAVTQAGSSQAGSPQDGSSQAAVDSDASDCPPADGGASGGGESGGADNSLTIIQTSVNEGMAPGVAPSTLAGTITNHGSASAYITRVTVSVESVTKAENAPPGSCDASDYVLLDTAMPVGRTLAPEESAPFAGADIGFSDKSINQDACKGATLHLLYVSS